MVGGYLLLTAAALSAFAAALLGGGGRRDNPPTPTPIDDDDGGEGDDGGDGGGDGEMDDDDDGDDESPSPLPPIVPPPRPVVPASIDDIRAAMCAIILPVADPSAALLADGVLPQDQPRRLVEIAARDLGPLSSATRKEAEQIAMRLLSGLQSCTVGDRFIAIDSPRGPGGFVQIRKGNTLLGIVRDLYPRMSPSQREDVARLVSRHPYNAGLLRATSNDYERRVFGDSIVAFTPRFVASPKTLQQRFDPGKSLGVIYLPPLTFEPDLS